MNDSKFTVTGTGDSLFLQEFPAEYYPALRAVAAFIGQCDLKMTNLETNFSDFEYFAGAYSGGTWLNTRRSCLSDLQKYGFNCYGTANNHCFDYSFAGLTSTIDTLDAAGLAHCGTGRSFDEAAAPAVIEVNGVRSAVFAVDASFENASRAGKPTARLKARPGVNYLRHDTVYKVSEVQMASLREIAESTRINYNRKKLIDTGFLTPDPEGFFFLGNLKYTTRNDVPSTSCHAGDKERLIGAVKAAKAQYDHVFIMIHCHDNDDVREENPPEYLKEFCHAAIDAGVSAIFGGGCHRLRPVEIYHHAPIFYSLGDFIYQGLRIEHLPADFMEKYGIDINSSAEAALYARSRGDKVGLHCNKLNYQTVLPKLEFSGGKMTGFSLLPLELNFARKDRMNGLPQIATGKEAQEICDLLNSLSEPYGVKLVPAGDGLLKPADL